LRDNALVVLRGRVPFLIRHRSHTTHSFACPILARRCGMLTQKLSLELSHLALDRDEQTRGASPLRGQCGIGFSHTEVSSGADGTGGEAGPEPRDARHALVRAKPTAAETPKRRPVAVPAIPAISPLPWLIPQPMLPKPPEGEHFDVADANPAIARTTEAPARIESRAGAATDVVHSGGGSTSGLGPFVRMREHPGTAITSRAGSNRRQDIRLPVPTVSPDLECCGPTTLGLIALYNQRTFPPFPPLSPQWLKPLPRNFHWKGVYGAGCKCFPANSGPETRSRCNGSRRQTTASAAHRRR
jgi:hypothetical protein